MIDRVESVFRKLLSEELARYGSKVITTEDQITFGMPEEDKPKKPEVCLYLQSLHENTQLRDESFKVFRKPGGQIGTKQHASVRMDLDFLVTANAADHTTEAQVLSDVLGSLIRVQAQMYNLALPELSAQGVQIIQLQIAQPNQPIHKEPTGFWLSHQVRQRPAIGATVTVSFNPYEAKQVRLVREAILGIIPMTETNGKAVQRGITATSLSIAGVVMNAAEMPIPGALVKIEGGVEQTMSDDQGLFFFLNQIEGPTTISISAEGYESASANTEVLPLGMAGSLEPIVVPLKSLKGDDALLAQLPDGAKLSNGKARLHRRTRVVSAIGRLFSEPDVPAAYVLVKCGEESTVTDGQGYFRVDLSDDETAPIIAVVPGVGEITVPAGNPEFILSPGKTKVKS